MFRLPASSHPRPTTVIRMAGQTCREISQDAVHKEAANRGKPTCLASYLPELTCGGYTLQKCTQIRRGCGGERKGRDLETKNVCLKGPPRLESDGNL